MSAVFCSCAITGGMSVPGQSAAIPVTPEEIVDSAVAAAAAGAAIVHIHVREPGTGKPVADLGLFKEVLAGIGERCDAIVQPTSGGGVGMTIEERARVVTECRPEMATFNCGSFNFGIFGVKHRPEMAAWEVDYLESKNHDQGNTKRNSKMKPLTTRIRRSSPRHSRRAHQRRCDCESMRQPQGGTGEREAAGEIELRQLLPLTVLRRVTVAAAALRHQVIAALHRR